MFDFKIPEGKFDLYIDVGLSHNAPHSKKVLAANPNVFVIGIEPNPESCKSIRSFHIPESFDRFALVPYGIANVDKMEYRKFNVTIPDPGTSSFLNITQHFRDSQNVSVSKVIDVPIVSLRHILDCVPWEKFNSTTFEMKSDTQGYECEVLKSLGDYIYKLNNIMIENSTGGQYKNAAQKEEIHKILEDSGMVLVRDEPAPNQGGDSWFVRK